MDHGVPLQNGESPIALGGDGARIARGGIEDPFAGEIAIRIDGAKRFEGAEQQRDRYDAGT